MASMLTTLLLTDVVDKNAPHDAAHIASDKAWRVTMAAYKKPRRTKQHALLITLPLTHTIRPVRFTPRQVIQQTPRATPPKPITIGMKVVTPRSARFKPSVP